MSLGSDDSKVLVGATAVRPRSLIPACDTLVLDGVDLDVLVAESSAPRRGETPASYQCPDSQCPSPWASPGFPFAGASETRPYSTLHVEALHESIHAGVWDAATVVRFNLLSFCRFPFAEASETRPSATRSKLRVCGPCDSLHLLSAPCSRWQSAPCLLSAPHPRLSPSCAMTRVP